LTVKITERDLEARRRAQAVWNDQKKQSEKVLEEREKARRADAEKVERLRTLRLAKEAEELKLAAKAVVRRGKRRV